MIRTSHTDPLRIAEVPAGKGLGVIGLTFCPGKKQAESWSGGWDRDLSADVREIALWGAAAVVSLIEQHEFDTLQVSGLGAAVADAHMTWFHLPIRDVSVPGHHFEQEWGRVGEQIRAILRSGFRVLVHCKGGLGRAGMISARLLVELGWDPDEAIAEVRRVRPGAIETSQQQAHVRACRTIDEPLRPCDDRAVEDRALGSLLGLAIGDALGSTLEPCARDSLPRVTAMIGGGARRLEPGQWTDATSMSLALADSLLAHPSLSTEDLMIRFRAWWRQGFYSCTGTCVGIGSSTERSLLRFDQTGDPVAGSRDACTAGDGSLARLAPVVIRGFAGGEIGGGVLASAQSETTHRAPDCLDACNQFAMVLYCAIAGKSRAMVLGHPFSAAEPAIRRVMQGSWRGKPRTEIRSSGYVADSLEAALWCVGRTGCFADALVLAANLGGNAASTAAITGQLAGGLYGASAIPASWLETLAWRGQIGEAARALMRPGPQPPIFRA